MGDERRRKRATRNITLRYCTRRQQEPIKAKEQKQWKKEEELDTAYEAEHTHTQQQIRAGEPEREQRRKPPNKNYKETTHNSSSHDEGGKQTEPARDIQQEGEEAPIPREIDKQKTKWGNDPTKRNSRTTQQAKRTGKRQHGTVHSGTAQNRRKRRGWGRRKRRKRRRSRSRSRRRRKQDRTLPTKPNTTTATNKRRRTK